MPPPGFLSPAGFAFSAPGQMPGMPQQVNEPQYNNPPYLIGTSQVVNGVTSINMKVTQATAPGDTITVFAGAYSTGSAPTAITDTQNNVYANPVVVAGGGVRLKAFVAVNPNPLGLADSITVTFAASIFGTVTAIGLPFSNPSGFGPAGSLVPDAIIPIGGGAQNPNQIFISFNSQNYVPEVALFFMCNFPYTTTGPFNLNNNGQQQVLATVTGPAAQAVNVLAGYQVIGPVRRTVSFQALTAVAPTASGAIGLTFNRENRYAPLQPPPVPTGMLSPSSWAFTPQAPQVVNDAPVPFAPYVIGQAVNNASVTSLTIPVQVPTNPGDAIAVMNGNTGGSASLVSCSDTKGNIYSIYVINQNAAAAAAIAVNPILLTQADSITLTWGSSAPRMATAIGVRSGVLGQVAAIAAVDGVASSSSATNQLNTSFTGIAGTSPEVIIYGVLYTTANGPLNWAPQWTPFTSVSASTFTYEAAWLLVPALANANIQAPFIFSNAGNMAGLGVSFLVETRFAPNKPYPDMPPGFGPPGAWQFKPLLRGGAITNTVYLPAKVTTTSSRQVLVRKNMHNVLTTTASYLRLYPRTFKAVVNTAGAFTSRLANLRGSIAVALRTMRWRSAVFSRWTTLATERWNVALSSAAIYLSSLEQVAVNVNTPAGLNPTGTTVQMAFLQSPPPSQPASSQWLTSTWQSTSAPYVALCLIGPGGVALLSQGQWYVWVKITGVPEVPVLFAGVLQVS